MAKGRWREALALVTALVSLACCVGSASAYELGPEPRPGGEPVEVQNPDGTWTRWSSTLPGGGRRLPLQTYTDTEHVTLERLYKGLQADTGTTGQSATAVQGATNANVAEDRALAAKLITGEPYKTRGELEVGNDLAKASEADRFLPAVGDVLGALNGAALAGSAALLGVSIGNGIDELLGWPQLDPLDPGGEDGEAGPGVEAEEKSFSWEPDVKLERVRPCQEEPGIPATGDCLAVQREARVTEKYRQFGTWHENSFLQFFGSAYSTGGAPASQPACSTSDWVECLEENGGKSRSLYERLSAEEAPPGEERPQIEAFPAPGLKEHYDQNSGEPSRSLLPMPEVTEPITPVAPSEMIVTEFIEHNAPELPGIQGERPGEPLTEIEIPKPEPAELGTHYQTRVQTAGFTHVRLNVLPESQIDTAVGPNEVAKVLPAAGTLAQPATEVVIDANPADAPQPTPPGEGGTVAGPNPPGIHIPNFALACTKFPFGVPCWIVKTVENWAGAGKAPSFTIPFDGKHIVVNLAQLEPLMEEVRPVLVIAGIIGIVLAFAAMARGEVPQAGEQMTGEP